MEPRIVDGDLLDQDVEVIVNAWNRNIIPWWLLLPQGVSGAIKKRGGLDPFRELGRKGAIPLGGAVETSAGRLPFRSIIHVAGINMLWRSSERSIRDAVRNAMEIAKEKGYRSIAFPLVGAGSGGGSPQKVLNFMRDELRSIEFDGEVRIVRYRPAESSRRGGRGRMWVRRRESAVFDLFGESDPHGMPPHFFGRHLRLNYAAAIRADTSKQDFTFVPRYWYIDATLRCARCDKEFDFTAVEQRS